MSSQTLSLVGTELALVVAWAAYLNAEEQERAARAERLRSLEQRRRALRGSHWLLPSRET